MASSGRVAGRGLRHDLGHHDELAEAALRLGVLPDDPHGVEVDLAVRTGEPDRHRRDPRTDRELVAAAGSVPDDLPDELVAHHDVAVGVVERSPGRVVDRHLGVVHEVDVRGADRRAQRPQEELPRTRHRVRGLTDLEPPLP